MFECYNVVAVGATEAKVAQLLIPQALGPGFFCQQTEVWCLNNDPFFWSAHELRDSPNIAMLEIAFNRISLRRGAEPITCLLCQWRTFSSSYRRLDDKLPPKDAPSQDDATPPSPLENAPRAYGKRTEDFTPVVLSRPIGMNFPPRTGENTGIDTRSLQQRRDDFVDYDKHLKRRKELYVQESCLSLL